MDVLRRALPYNSQLAIRELGDIDLVVIHCTELPDLDTARSYGETIHYPDSDTGNSGHYYIDRDGHCECWVDVDRVAYHTRGYNARAVGIELVNRGRYPNWLDSRQQHMQEEYPAEQIAALLQLLGQLQIDLHALHWIAGHEDLDTELVPASDQPSLLVSRKVDPGPRFPWAAVLAGIRLQRMQADDTRSKL